MFALWMAISLRIIVVMVQLVSSKFASLASCKSLFEVYFGTSSIN